MGKDVKLIEGVPDTITGTTTENISTELENQDSSYSKKWKDENVREYKEVLFNRISQLLIEKFTLLEEHIGNINSLQKTIRNQEIKVGIKSEDEPVVIFQSDIEVNYEDKDITDSIFSHFNFINPKYISLRVDNQKLFLTCQNLNDLSINSLVNNIIGLKNLKLKDNISQFIEIPTKKISIDKDKLNEYIDNTFIEIKPVEQ